MDHDKEEYFKKALEGKNIPILPIDTNWHRLFTQTDPTPEIQEQAEIVTALLKQQGKVNNDIKTIRKQKSKLMNDIVTLMDDSDKAAAKSNEKKMDETRKMIEKLNVKMEELEDEALEIPRKLRDENYQLMLLTMDECYNKIRDNTEEIETIGNWITDIRVELKKKVIRKQEKEVWNFNLYSYMHSIFDKDVINIFDMKYDPSINPPSYKKKEAPKKEEAETNGEQKTDKNEKD